MEILQGEITTAFLRDFKPGREQCWVAERAGMMAGAVLLVDAGDNVGQLRLLHVEPWARGLGIGSALVAECVSFAREAGYRLVRLWTHTVLLSARRIYEAQGFRIVATAGPSRIRQARAGRDLGACADRLSGYATFVAAGGRNMKVWLALVGMLACDRAAQAANPAKPALLILGTPHFGNPGRDTVNVRVPDVLTPERQREIEALVERLAAFRPTRVAVEWPADEQARLDQRYADYRAGRFQLTANERDQIGLRLAARLGLTRVDAVDWSGDAPGRRPTYDYPAWAEAHGRGSEWRAWVGRFQAEADASARLMACTPVSAWVRGVNTPAYRLANHRSYFHVAQIGDARGDNPGAAWVGTWYTRNLRILNNLRSARAGPAGPRDRHLRRGPWPSARSAGARIGRVRRGRSVRPSAGFAARLMDALPRMNVEGGR